MKRNTWKVVTIAFIAIIVMTLLAACGERKNYDTQSDNKARSNTAIDKKQGTKAGETFNLKQGSFVIPEGWQLHEGDSTDDKPFVVPVSHSGEGKLDNISVQHGTNPYSKDDIDSFAHAILLQLNQQISGHEASQILASGFTSKQGYPILKYEFTVDGDRIVQY